MYSCGICWGTDVPNTQKSPKCRAVIRSKYSPSSHRHCVLYIAPCLHVGCVSYSRYIGSHSCMLPLPHVRITEYTIIPEKKNGGKSVKFTPCCISQSNRRFYIRGSGANVITANKVVTVTPDWLRVIIFSLFFLNFLVRMPVDCWRFLKSGTVIPHGSSSDYYNYFVALFIGERERSCLYLGSDWYC